MNQNCPSSRHFHVVGTDVYETNDLVAIIKAKDPNEALDEFVKTLTAEWEGSIEVNDHATLKPSAMPLIDFWRTPTRS